jgi:hypothetical protein
MLFSSLFALSFFSFSINCSHIYVGQGGARSVSGSNPPGTFPGVLTNPSSGKAGRRNGYTSGYGGGRSEIFTVSAQGVHTSLMIAGGGGGAAAVGNAARNPMRSGCWGRDGFVQHLRFTFPVQGARICSRPQTHPRQVAVRVAGRPASLGLKGRAFCMALALASPELRRVRTVSSCPPFLLNIGSTFCRTFLLPAGGLAGLGGAGTPGGRGFGGWCDGAFENNLCNCVCPARKKCR